MSNCLNHNLAGHNNEENAYSHRFLSSILLLLRMHLAGDSAAEEWEWELLGSELSPPDPDPFSSSVLAIEH